MNVVDSSAWLSYFAGDDNAAIFAEAIENQSELVVPSITITEVFKYILRQSGEESALTASAHMEQGKIVPLDAALAKNAAAFGMQYKLPLADSIIFATANIYSAVIWTQDSDFEGLRNVKFIPKASN